MTQPVEALEALIKDLRWEHFEANDLGQIEVGGKLFCMRIGIHMNRPVQAIICDGQFVRMRSADFYGNKILLKIDPERLSESLYIEATTQGWPKWRPYLPDHGQLVGAQQRASNQVPGVYLGNTSGGVGIGGGGGSVGTAQGRTKPWCLP